jgi:hypothetical protein
MAPGVEPLEGIDMNASELGHGAAKIDAQESLAARRSPDWEEPEFAGPNPWRHEALEAHAASVELGQIDEDDDDAKDEFVAAYIETMNDLVG